MFFVLKKKSVFFVFWVGCNVDVWVKSDAVVFKSPFSMYDFRFGIQMANVILPCEQRIISSNYTPTQNRIRIS